MARKLQQKLQQVSVYIRIRTAEGKQPYCPAIWESKKRLRPHWCLVRGKPEHHPEGTYHVRYRVNGKPVWEKVCVGDDPYGAADLAALRQSQFADSHDTASQRIVDEHKPEPVETEPAKHRLDDEVRTYLSNVAKLAPKTHAAYKLTLDLFQQSCSKIFVHQVSKQDLQAFDSFLLKQGHEDRTRANRIQHVITFLRNKEGRRAGPPVTDVSIRVKYVEQPVEAFIRQELENLFKASRRRQAPLAVPARHRAAGRGNRRRRILRHQRRKKAHRRQREALFRIQAEGFRKASRPNPRRVDRPVVGTQERVVLDLRKARPSRWSFDSQAQDGCVQRWVELWQVPRHPERPARLMCRRSCVRALDFASVPQKLRDRQTSSRCLCSPNPEMVGSQQSGNHAPLLGNLG
jgi:hypothetical protein